MALLTPTSPTINDLLYNALNAGGSLQTTAFVPPLSINLQQAVNTRESSNLVQPGISYKVNTSDFVAVDAIPNRKVAIQLPGPIKTYSVQVFDVAATSENVATTKSLSIALTGANAQTVSHTENVVVTES